MKKDLLSIWEFLREFQPLCIGVLDSKEEKKGNSQKIAKISASIWR